MSHTDDRDMQQCIEDCLTCHNTCLETATHCIDAGGKHTEGEHIRLLLDCAQICQTSADFMLPDSGLHGYICAACAAVCERCAQDCERFPADEQMRGCAETCRASAASRRKTAAMAQAA